MNKPILGLLGFTSLGALLVAGCPDDGGFLETGTGASSASSTRASNSALSSVGVGGYGGEGTGASGGAGGRPPNECEQACDKFDQCASDVDRCTQVGVDCDANPWHPNANIVCILECIGDAESACTDIGDYFLGTAVPGPGSKFIQCISACNTPPGPGTGVFACVDCLTGANEGGTTGYCLADLQCGSDQACNDWFGCASACSDPTCFRACDTQHAAAATYYDPFYQCVCNDIPPGETVQLFAGQARCWDVCAGVMDACGA